MLELLPWHIQTDMEAAGGIAIRYGEEEILCILPALEPRDLPAFAKQLKTRVGALPIPLDTGETIDITICTGMPQSPNINDFTHMVALYRTKQTGRNRVVYRSETIAS